MFKKSASDKIYKMRSKLLVVPLVLGLNLLLYEQHVFVRILWQIVIHFFTVVSSCPLLIVSSVGFLLLLEESGAVVWKRGCYDGKEGNREGVGISLEGLKENDASRINKNGYSKNIQRQKIPQQSSKRLEIDGKPTEEHSRRLRQRVDGILLLCLFSGIVFVLGNGFGCWWLPRLFIKIFVQISTAFTDIFILQRYSVIGFVFCIWLLNHLEQNEKKTSNSTTPSAKPGSKYEIKRSEYDLQKTLRSGFEILNDASGVVMCLVLALTNISVLLNCYDKWFLPWLVYRSFTLFISIIINPSHPLVVIASVGFVLRKIGNKNRLGNKGIKTNNVDQGYGVVIRKSKYRRNTNFHTKKNTVMSTIMVVCLYTGMVQNSMLLPLLISECVAHIIFLVILCTFPLLLIHFCQQLHLRSLQGEENEKSSSEGESVLRDEFIEPPIASVELNDAQDIQDGSTRAENVVSLPRKEAEADVEMQEMLEMINELDVILVEDGISSAQTSGDEMEQDIIRLEGYDSFDVNNNNSQGKKKKVFIVEEDITSVDTHVAELESVPEIFPDISSVETTSIDYSTSSNIESLSPEPSPPSFNNIPDEKFQISEELFQTTKHLTFTENIAVKTTSNKQNEQKRSNSSSETTATTPSESRMSAEDTSLQQFGGPTSQQWPWNKQSLVFRNVPRLFARMRRRVSVRSHSLENISAAPEEEEVD